MRRSKENVEYWQDRIDRLFEISPDHTSVTKRYDTLKLILQEKYPFIKDNDNIQFLKDVVYLDRELRRETEGLETEWKDELEVEKQRELGYNV